jgi:hypothetical protein
MPLKFTFIQIHRPEIQDELTRSLATMRVDYEMRIKDLDTSINNPLLNKRRKRDRDSGQNQAGEASNYNVTKF